MIVGISLVWIALTAWASEKKAPEDRVAVVNGAVITRADFDREMASARQRLLASGRPPGDSQQLELGKSVLENMINFELLYEEAEKSGVQVEEGAVEKRLEAIKKRFPNEEEFKKALAGMNLSEAALKSQTRKGVMVGKFVDMDIAKDTSVSDKDVKAYYDQNLESFKQPEQVRASHILIKVGPEAKETDKALALKKLQEIQQRLKKGEDFGALAKEFSEGPTSAKGGDLGYFRRGQMASPLGEVAFGLAPGQVSDIVKTDFGYHLIKCIDKKPETTIAYAAIKDRLREYLKQQKIREKVGAYLEDLKKKAKIERYLPEKP
jgi:peptidyl-prolyl cis-trans isomerase C